MNIELMLKVYIDEINQGLICDPAGYWQSGSLPLSNLILGKQLNFIHHLSNFPEDALARTIFANRLDFHYPEYTNRMKNT